MRLRLLLYFDRWFRAGERPADIKTVPRRRPGSRWERAKLDSGLRRSTVPQEYCPA